MTWLLLALSLPIHTPGAIRPRMTQETICSTKWGHVPRRVDDALKRNVTRLYGIPWRDRLDYEFDHLIPRELGGSDELDNIWPQPLAEARQKDLDENRLHRLVCAGKMRLEDAQQQMRHWGQHE